MKVFYSPAYASAAHGFDTTRKAKRVAESLRESPIEGVEVVEPRPLSFDEIATVHDPAYVRAVQTGEPRSLAESQGFPWDSGFWNMVTASNGGVLAAAQAALRDGVAGSLSSGLHHARRDRGAGFCTFNGLAIAARQALASGAESVLILDLDAHCGGGTASLIEGDPGIWQVDVSTSSFDEYTSRERARLTMVTDASAYLDTVEQGLAHISHEGPRFALCLYNAGVDPCEDCDIGGLRGITGELLARRDRLVFDWCSDSRIPVAFVLAGGYAGTRLDHAALVRLHCTTLLAATQARPPNAESRS